MDYMMKNENENFTLANTIPHCAVMLVLDTSHSMWGQGLTDMMASLRTFYKTIANSEFPDAQVDIAAVSMGDNLKMLEEFTPIRDSELPALNIRPKGDTPIGAALELALAKVAEKKQDYVMRNTPFVTPNLIILSDGKSTDDFAREADRIRQAVSCGQLCCRAIVLGNDYDLNALKQIAGENVIMPDYTGMRGAFENVGRVVSQVYEEEAAQTIVDQQFGSKTTVGKEYILDGSNILHWDEYRTGITMKYVLSMAKYMKENQIPFTVYFDATAPHLLRNKANASEVKCYEKCLKDDPEHFKQVPAGTRADDFILFQADQNPEAAILTHDLYRDHKDKYPWIRDRKRVVPGMLMGNLLLFSEISLQILVLQDADPSWA